MHFSMLSSQAVCGIISFSNRDPRLFCGVYASTCHVKWHELWHTLSGLLGLNIPLLLLEILIVY